MPELKKREDMDSRYQWRLEDMYASQDAFEADFAKAGAGIAAFAAYEGHVSENPAGIVKAYFELKETVEKLYVYSSMRRDVDAGKAEYQQLFQRAQGLSVRSETACAFLTPELLSMDEGALKDLMKDPSMKDYDTFLRGVLREKPHVLPGEQEKLLSMAQDVLSGPADAFGMLNNVDLPMPEVKNADGSTEKLTQATYGIRLRSRDREVRKSAFEGMMNAFKSFSSTVSVLYSSAVKGDLFIARARKFPSCLEASLYPDEVPVSVYENLLESVKGTLPALTEYLNIRKKRLGVDELHMYDLYVPIADSFDMKLSFEEAYDLVLEALRPLGEDYVSVLRAARHAGWADVYENKNKRSGAYSWGCYDTHPYVLLNHTDDLNGCMTLAHELGHAMHSYFSNGAQPFAKAGYSLFVAEVASTCNEVLMLRHLMKKYAGDKAATAFLCNQLLESFRTTLFRQAMFAAFEKRVHEMAEKGEPLTADSMTAEYLALNGLYYGGGCTVDELIGAEWMRIPHFYTSFYVYKYATGFSAAVAIADRILREGESAVKDYRRFLSAGCSVPPLEALRWAGVDMEKKETVDSAMRVFADTVKQLGAALE